MATKFNKNEWINRYYKKAITDKNVVVIKTYDNGINTVVVLNIDNDIFVGMAKCHPDDINKKDEKFGIAFAYFRAYKQYYANGIPKALFFD